MCEEPCPGGLPWSGRIFHVGGVIACHAWFLQRWVGWSGFSSADPSVNAGRIDSAMVVPVRPRKRRATASTIPLVILHACPGSAGLRPRLSVRGSRGSLDWVHVKLLRSRPPALPPRSGRHPLGARASRPHPFPANAPSPASLRTTTPAPLSEVLRRGAPDRPEMPLVAGQAIDATGCDPVGGYPISRTEGEQWRPSRLIELGEIAAVVPGLVRAGRPRSQEVVIR